MRVQNVIPTRFKFFLRCQVATTLHPSCLHPFPFYPLIRFVISGQCYHYIEITPLVWAARQ